MTAAEAARGALCPHWTPYEDVGIVGALAKLRAPRAIDGAFECCPPRTCRMSERTPTHPRALGPRAPLCAPKTWARRHDTPPNDVGFKAPIGCSLI